MTRFPWAPWAALCGYVCAMLALWGLYPSAPAWAVIAGLSGALLGLWVIEVGAPRRAARRARWAEVRAGAEGLGAALAAAETMAPPQGDTVAEFLAEVDRRMGTGGAVSGAAVPPNLILWGGAQLSLADHDHGPGAPPCAACLATLGLLARLGGAQAEARERVADTGDLRAVGLGGPPEASGVILCGALLGAHRCGERGAHDRHRCECGTVWGRASMLGHSYNWQGRPLPPWRPS